MKHIQYSRKINQFRNTARHVNELIETGSWQSMQAEPKRHLHWKLSTLFETVKNLLSKKELKKVLAAAAFLVCIGTVNAQTFAPSVNNPYGLASTGGYNLPQFADMDDDGDLDIFTAHGYGVLKYYQNTGTPTSPAFIAPVTNPFGIAYPALGFRPVTVDIDNDGDLDLFTGEYYGVFKYFENTGTPSSPAFAAPSSNPFGLDSAQEAGFPAFADFDNDGDFDMLTTEYYGVFKYYENTGTASAPAFAVPVSSPFTLSPPNNDIAFLTVCDLDGDSDTDLLVGEWSDPGNMYYFQNNGTASSALFAAGVLNPFNLTAAAGIAVPTFGDLDTDGDFDLVVGDTTGNFIYFENTTIGALSDYADELNFSISPNPASGYFNIYTAYSNKEYELAIKEMTGKLVFEKVLQDTESTINTASLVSGIYFIELSDGQKVSHQKLIIE